MRKRKKVLALLLCASMTAGMVPVTSNAEGDGQLIATYVNQVPEMDGVTWADDVAAETFANAWETVTASTASDSGTGGTTYQVEVVPEDLVYFIDSYSNAPSADDSTPVYDAVKALVPDLKNEAADQLYVEGENTWGLSGSVNTKGNTTATDKTDTGVYGSSNASGSSLSYSLYLEAGTYTITSEHHDWWWMDRPMSISLSHDGTDETLGSISLNNSHNNEIVSYDFTIKEDQTVTYTVTATGSQAPIISWLAVSKAEEPDPILSAALEDNDGVTVRNGATLEDDYDGGKMVSINVDWISGGNSAGDGGAVINSADSYFAKDAFTLYTDFKVLSNQSGSYEKGAVILVGTSDNNIALMQHADADTAVLSVSGTETPLTIEIKDNQWYAAALAYSEDDTQGYITVYANGEKVSDAIPLGFKFSEQSGITAGVGINYATGFMRSGSYDNIVVTDSADEEAILAETELRYSDLADRDAAEQTITISGSDVETAAKNVNGLTWKGWGLLSGNGTSNLLMDYRAENETQYWEMLEYLFGGDNPLFTHVKMEMGNDGNNSTAASSCTMRSEDEEADASRDPGFQLAADAKKINPDIKVSILRWGMPNWVSEYWNSDRTGAGYEAMYKWYKETIFDAYEKYGYVVDFINPDTNETSSPDNDFIKWFADRVENETEFPEYFTAEAKEAYNSIRIIASDENKSLNIVPNMRADEDLYNAVDIIGFHYRTDATDDYVTMADVDDKEVWYSEGCATFGYTEMHENKNTEYGYESIGGYQSPLAMAENFIVSFDSSRRTHYIFQPAIGGFYEGIQYGHKELLSARDPWSGYIHYDPALQIIAQFSRFAETGWENEDNTAGIWRLISQSSAGAFAGSSNEHATSGIDGNASYLTMASPDKTDFSTVFINNTQNEKTYYIKTEDMALSTDTLNLWETATDSYMTYQGTVKQADGVWEITLKPYSILTATTLNNYADGAETGTTPAELAMPSEGINTEDRTVLDTDETGRGTETEDEYLYADNFEYEEEAEGYLESRGNEPRYMVDTHGAWVVEDGRLVQESEASMSQWNGGEPMTIVGDFRWMNYITEVDIEIADSDAWAGVGVRTQTGMNWDSDGYTLRVYGSGDWTLYRSGSAVSNGTVENADGKFTVRLAAMNSTVTAFINGEEVCTYTDSNAMDAGRIKLSTSWNKVSFDNLTVKTIDGTIPYATSMADGQDDSVTYEGGWNISGSSNSGNSQAGSADRWYRTNSVNTEDGASFTFQFPVSGTGFSIIGNNSAPAVLDVYVDDMETPYESDVSTSSASNRYASYTLTGLENDLHTVKVVIKSGTLNIDALYTLGETLAAEDDAVVSVETDLPETLVVKAGNAAEGLPEEVEVLTASGDTVTMAVTWDNDPENFMTPLTETVVTGTVEGGTTVLGTQLTVSVPVTVIPDNILYFANPSKDPVSSDYTLIMDASADTLKHTAEDNDQAYDESIGFGYTGTEGNIRDNNTDIYESMRYADMGESITYQFDLESDGEYEVYIGMFDPSGWYNDHGGNRYADILINEETVEEGYQYLNNTNDTLHYTDVTADENGRLTIEVAQNAASTRAVQVSFIIVTDASEDPTYEVTFDGNGGSDTASQSVIEGGRLVRPEDPTREGYTFTGWYTDKELTTLYDFDAAVTGSFTLYAGWEEAEETTYEISFAGNGGSETESQFVVKNGKLVRPEDPTREGYTFTGWYIDEELTTLYDFDAAVTGSFTLYAGWEAAEDPDQPGPEDPDNPGTEDPDQPGTEDPDKPGTEDPDQPGTEDPDKPGTEDPDQPGPEDPDNPGTEDPDNQGDSGNGTSDGQSGQDDGKGGSNTSDTSKDNTAKAAKTGDNTGIALYVTISALILSAAGIVLCLRRRSRR